MTFWIWTIYLAIGTWIMLPAIVEGYREDNHISHPVKIIASIISILIWPLIFIM